MSDQHDKGNDQKFKEKDGKPCCRGIIKNANNNKLANGMDNQGGIDTYSWNTRTNLEKKNLTYLDIGHFFVLFPWYLLNWCFFINYW